VTDPGQQIVALTDTDRTWYLLPTRPFGPGYQRRDTTWVTAAGHQLTPAPSARNGGWYHAPGQPQNLTATQPGPATKTGYRLNDDDAASIKFPAHLTPAEWIERDFDDDTATALYSAVWEDGEPVSVVFPVADMIVVGDGEPVPDDGLQWVPNIRDELRHHPAVWHLFPGHLTGFRQAVLEAIKAPPAMAVRPEHSGLRGPHACIDRDHPAVIEVSTYAAYEPRQTRFERAIGRNGAKLKRGRDVVEATRLAIRVPVADRIEGVTRAAAVTAWNTELARILDAVTEALSPAPCWHCKGTGVVSQTKAEANR